MEPANLQTVSNNYVISAQCYPTKAQKVKIDALIEKIQPTITVLVVQMKKTNAKRHGTLVRKFYHAFCMKIAHSLYQHALSCYNTI